MPDITLGSDRGLTGPFSALRSDVPLPSQKMLVQRNIIRSSLCPTPCVMSDLMGISSLRSGIALPSQKNARSTQCLSLFFPVAILVLPARANPQTKTIPFFGTLSPKWRTDKSRVCSGRPITVR